VAQRTPERSQRGGGRSVALRGHASTARLREREADLAATRVSIKSRRKASFFGRVAKRHIMAPQNALDLVGGITEYSSRIALKNLFAQFGEVTACWIPPLEARRNERAYVKFGTTKAAQSAMDASVAGQLYLDGVAICAQWRLAPSRTQDSRDFEARGSNLMTSRDLFRAEARKARDEGGGGGKSRDSRRDDRRDGRDRRRRSRSRSKQRGGDHHRRSRSRGGGRKKSRSRSRQPAAALEDVQRGGKKAADSVEMVKDDEDGEETSCII